MHFLINFIFSNEILKRNRNAKKWWPYLCKFDKKSVSAKTDIAFIWFMNELHLENNFAVKIIFFIILNKL